MIVSFNEYMGKIDSILESAITEYEIQALTENQFTNMKDADLSQETGLRKAGLVVVKALAVAWDKIVKFIQKILGWMADKLVGPAVEINVPFDAELCDRIVAAIKDAKDVLAQPEARESAELKANMRQAEELITNKNPLNQDMATLSQWKNRAAITGQPHRAQEVKAKLKQLYTAASSLKAALEAHKNDKYGKTTYKDIQTLQKVTADYVDTLQKELIRAVSHEKTQSDNVKNPLKKHGERVERAAKNYSDAEKEYSVMGDSVETITALGEILRESSIIYRNGRSAKSDQYMTKLLSDASVIIREAIDDVGSDIDHASVDTAGDAAGDVEYEEIAKTLDADETTEEDDDYDPEVSGGGDNQPEVSDLSDEDIADVIGGDDSETKEAIAILTDDDGSATIDEAVIIDFGL